MNPPRGRSGAAAASAARRGTLAVVLVVACLLAACSSSGWSDEDSAHNRLGTAGMAVTIDGAPAWPVGINAYQLGTDWRVNTGCGAQVDLDAYFASLPPNTMTRFNAYSSFVVNKQTGLIDFSPLDAVFEAAARHHQLLNAVLASSEGACEAGGFKGNAWFDGRWRADVLPGEPMPFAEWVDTAVRRWGDSPAAAGWTAVGESEASICGSENCDWRSRDCPANAATLVRQFLDEVGARIRRLDPDAVLWGGRAGGGQCGSAGDDYAFVGASPGIDVLEYHDYEVGYELPGDPVSGLGRRIEQARQLNKPLVITELGVNAGSCLSTAGRYDLASRTVERLREAGTAGVQFWAFVPDPRSAECTYDIGPDDPLMDLLGERG